ncbi:hypothetical protein PG993_007095 [Apiospora rasikravindrae]|uniref:F-box domain-containing protein n=1 Tax=Apiospora rasikravindrae TaxID=990691 RepID=A0ABR1SWH8_9PEZI
MDVHLVGMCPPVKLSKNISRIAISDMSAERSPCTYKVRCYVLSSFSGSSRTHFDGFTIQDILWVEDTCLGGGVYRELIVQSRMIVDDLFLEFIRRFSRAFGVPNLPRNISPRLVSEIYPPELLLRIVSDVLPEGFESLALSCKDIYQLCKPFLKHHNLLRAQFHRFDYRPRPSRVLQGPLWRPLRNAFDLLERIAAEPIVARYIRHADFAWDSYPSTHSLPPQVPDHADRGPVVKLFTNFPYLNWAGLEWKVYYTRVAEEYEKSRSTRFSQHAAAFLLTLLPNIKSLLLPRYWEPTEETDKLIKVVIDKARHQQNTPQPSPSMAQVTRFGRHPGARQHRGLYPALALFGAPRDAVDERTMEAFLRPTTRLKTLVYYHTIPGDDIRPNWDVCSFLRVIEREAGSQLERLCVKTSALYDELVPGPLSLRNVLQLRDLVLPLDVFQCDVSHAASRFGKSIGDLDEEDSETVDLRLGNLIPASVTQLTLLSRGRVPHDKILGVLFRDFGATRAARLPDMEQIILECQSSYSPDPAYRAKCESLVSEVGTSGVALHVETEPLWPALEWPGSETFECFTARLSHLAYATTHSINGMRTGTNDSAESTATVNPPSLRKLFGQRLDVGPEAALLNDVLAAQTARGLEVHGFPQPKWGLPSSLRVRRVLAGSGGVGGAAGCYSRAAVWRFPLSVFRKRRAS